MVNIQHFYWIYKCSSVAEYYINSLCTELSSLLCIQSSWWYIKGMINGHQGKMLNMLYMYILIYWWNRLIFRAAINWFSNHSRKTTLFISWWWSPSFDLARNTKSQPSILTSRTCMQNNQTFAFTRGYFWGIRPIIRKPHIICAVILVNPCFIHVHDIIPCFPKRFDLSQIITPIINTKHLIVQNSSIITYFCISMSKINES